MKSYLSLIPLSARVRKRQNRMTLLCIVISVFLVTAIFSMADMAVRMEKTRLGEEHGYWHIMLKEPTRQQVEQLAARSDVRAIARYDGLNYDLAGDYSIGGKTCVIAGADSDMLTGIYEDLTEGRYPEAEDEMLLSNEARAMLSLEVGDTVTLHTPAGDFDYTVCGFGGDVTITDNANVVGASLSWEGFEALAAQQGAPLAPVCFVRFDDGTNVRRVVAQLRQDWGLADETLSENTAMLGLSGSSSDPYVMGLYLVAGILFLLVLAAGVFMIAGSLNSQTAQRTQFFGMLRCIGASRAQIMHIVRLEALCWCKTAVPIGVAAGIAGTWFLCALLRFGAGGEFVQIPLFGVSGIGIVSGVVVGVLTVLLSSRSPARRAANVSPVAAVAGNTAKNGAAARPVKPGFWRIETALGIHHAMSSPKNLLLMTGSFALSIVMLFSFSVLVQWVQMALDPLKPWAPDVFYASSENLCEIEKDFAARVESLPFVERAFGRMYKSLPAEYGGTAGNIDLISYEDQQFRRAEDSLVDGDMDAVRAGEGVLTVFDESNTLRVSDVIRLEGARLTVAGVLDDSPFDTSDQPTVICSEALFQALTGEEGYAILDVQLTKDAAAADVDQLRELAGARYDFYDRLDQNKDSQNTYYMFCLFVYGFLVVIILITIIHTANSISMSVFARTKQYGAMRAVGMDDRQMKKMIAAESAAYTVLGLIAGCGLGLPLHRFLYVQMVTNYWGIAWQPPLASVGGILALLTFTALFTSAGPGRRICATPVAETINEL